MLPTGAFTAMGCAAPLRSERGFALVGSLLVMVLVTALAGAAIFLSQLDLTLAGNYRAQRTAEVAADGALDLVKVMIYGDVPLLNLPLGLPATNAAALAWRAGADTNGDGVGDGVVYVDADIDVAMTLMYKQEDNVNFNTAETFADEVVRYGKDYKYQSAQKDIGKQPVYTAILSDNRTGVKAEADLISTIGFRSPAAIYVKGKIRMTKNPYANEELIEVTSGAGTPALATTKSRSDANVFIQRAVSLPDTNGRERSYTEQFDPFDGVASTFTYYPDYRAENSLCVPNNPGAILTHPTPMAPYCPLTLQDTTGGGPLGTYVPPKQCWTDLYPRVYSGAPNPQTGEIGAEIAAGRYNEARDMMHILLGVGERTANLNGAAGYAASKAIFNFDATDAAVVQYDYRNPNGTVPTLEDLIGASFADLRSLADQVLVGDETVPIMCGILSPCPNPANPICIDASGSKDLSNRTLGTAAAPQLVFFESNMNDDGSANGNPALSLVTNGGPVHGYGILVINGDAVIYGSIDWTGLMVVRGKLVFKPWQGGTGKFRSGPELSTRWNGFIMIGGDPSNSTSLDDNYGLHLWTYYGGSLILGFSTSEVASIKGIISKTVPHKILAWRRTYN